ncbi:MAG: tetratricopeptide repeat protein [Thermodesulfobacteriota bacterium]
MFKRTNLLIGLFLVMATLAVYWPVKNYEFVNLDDDIYVYENRYVKKGLTCEGFNWAFLFSKKEGHYWHPLTWLSHMLDCELFGLDAGMHHLVNAFFHAMNSLLLFLALRRMSGASWPSAFVAAVFAFHPIQVESVAWVTERKNTLSTFFWMLTLLTYARYCRQPGSSGYVLTLFLFCLGLLSKPMLVTMPFVLLLLDFWPLGRMKSMDKGGRDKEAVQFVSNHARFPVPGLLLEKVPFLLLSMLSVYLSALSLERQDGLIVADAVPIDLRMANAIVSYVRYLGNMIWPQDLIVLYPFPKSMIPMWKVLAAGLVLCCISIFVMGTVKRWPYLFTGWGWFLGSLVPVIGLIQGGLWPAMADRWAYVPLIGVSVMIGWGAMGLPARRCGRKWLLGAGVILVVSGLIWITRNQLGYWKDSITLWRHTLEVNQDHPLPHSNLGTALAEQGRMDEAIFHYLASLRINPHYAMAHNNLGNLLERQGRLDEAVAHYLEALRIRPTLAEAHHNLGNALRRQGRVDEAISHYREALRTRPDFAEAHANLGNILGKMGRVDEALTHYREALRIRPEQEGVYYNLGIILASQGRMDEAITHYREALSIRPDFAEAHINLGAALFQKGDIGGAAEHFREVLRIRPGHAIAEENLQRLLKLYPQGE